MMGWLPSALAVCRSLAVPFWIPAYAGMTVGEIAGRTVAVAAITLPCHSERSRGIWNAGP